MTELNSKQTKRYARNVVMPEVGEAGQEKLLASKVLVVGAGGLASPVLYYLAAAGVGGITVYDPDPVELSNLQRQVLYTTDDLGRKKVECAKKRLEALNPDVKVTAVPERVTEANIEGLLKNSDVAVDASDNFPARFLLNDVAVKLGIPFVHAGVSRMGGQALTVVPGKGPCYRCVFAAEPPEGSVPRPEETGVLGAAVGVIASLEAVEVVKIILGGGELLTGRLVTFDGLAGTFREVELPRNPKCEACGGGRYEEARNKK